VSELLELADRSPGDLLLLLTFEEVAAKVGIELPAREERMDDLQLRVRDRDDGSLVPTAAADTPVLRLQVAVLAGRAERRLDQRSPQPRTAFRCSAVLPFPALSLLPGHRPAHDAKWRLVGKRVMSVPISAITTSAVRRWIPGMVSRAVIAPCDGSNAPVIRSSTCVIASSR
jgi:hypothetical protein